MQPGANKIRNMDFIFENSKVRIVSNRNCPEIRLPGLNIGPFEEGSEYETHYWIANELDKSGVAHFREDEVLGPAKLNKIQWTERVQTVGQIAKLPDFFYPKLRRYISESRRDAAQSPEKMLEYEKARQLTRDIVNSRLRKIVSVASAPAQVEQVLKNLTEEERFLYENLFALINGWRSQILECEEVEE